MKTGFIGTGNMGRILIEAFIEAGALSPSSIRITNRTKEKAEAIKRLYPGIRVEESAAEVIQSCDLIFICVKPLDIHPLISNVSSLLTDDKILVSITSPISVSQLESSADCQAVRAIPSITNRALSGVSLVTYGERCTLNTRVTIQALFEMISKPVPIKEEITRIASDIVSCGPAFFSYLLQRFIEAAVSETKIDKETAVLLASEMLIGMGNLLESERFTLPALQAKVCVKGGITGEGIKVLEKETGKMFEHLFQSTHAKYYEDIHEIEEQFSKETL
ncbi:late competence protein ComER [Metabacillus sp. GX 13764]|uniref:late competence protein ComER n=1 Tax=Metabacillus kandeliae TaxID=2900151 RepID=UPI001E4BDAA1|nr:late competence protein ComER [Metabacillus kandeliae]MCD7033028.1 late competence protein ComER [Metabacillus kandeliae]